MRRNSLLLLWSFGTLGFFIGWSVLRKGEELGAAAAAPFHQRWSVYVRDAFSKTGASDTSYEVRPALPEEEGAAPDAAASDTSYEVRPALPEEEGAAPAAASYRQLGFVYVRDALPASLVDRLAAKISSYVANRGEFAHPAAGGVIIPDFVKEPFLADVFQVLHENGKIRAALDRIFGQPMGTGKGEYRWLSHNDIGVNVKSAWHKDRLSGIYRGYERDSPWDAVDGEEMRIVKVAMYLQDHSKPSDHSGLRVIRSSHTVDHIPGVKYNISFLHPAKGDAIIFDQRITHGGQGRLAPTDHVAADELNTTGPGEQLLRESRILLQLGYGWNNIHSDSFEMGTRMRQKIFQSRVCNYNGYSPCALKLVQADFAKRGIHFPCNDAAVCPDLHARRR